MMRPERWLHTVPPRVRSLLHWTRADRELDEELRDHLDCKTEHYIHEGMAPAAARRQALLDMGGIERTKEYCRDARGFGWAQDFARDLRYALRMLRRAPGFATIAVLTLALGIGANTAVFSMVDAVLLRSFPYRHPDRLALVFDVPIRRPDATSGISYRDFTDIREHSRAFSEIAGNAFHDLTVTGVGEPFIVNTAAVTGDLFSVLGASPLVGRTLVPRDDRQGAPPVAVLGEALWRSRFGSNRDLIGRSITLDMRSFTVVGVLPASFHYPDGFARQEVWIPIAQDPLFGPLMSQAGTRLLGAIGRLKPGVSPTAAQSEMKTLAAGLAAQFPAQDGGFTVRVVPYRQAVVRNVKLALLVLMGAVGLVLLIACVNIANLLLSRASLRQREIALRIALGAGRGRILRQLLVESALLGLLGAAAGVVVAAASIGILQPLLPAQLTRIGSIHVGGAVLLFAIALSLVSALVFGLAPAALTAPARLQANIVEGGERGGRRRGRLRNVLAAIEISLAMVLMTASGLLIRSFARVTSVNPGFDAGRVIEAEISLPRFFYSTPRQWRTFASEFLRRLQAQPGLQDSALGAPLPMDRQGAASFPFSIVGAPPLPPGKVPTADYATVSPHYFRVMRIPLLRGRFFTDRDSDGNPKTAIVSATLARRYFRDEDPIGREMEFGFPPDVHVTRRIVGVVGDVRDVALSRAPGPMMYVPFAQEPLWGAEVVIRTSLSVSSAAAEIREAAASIDKDLPVTDVGSLQDALGHSIAQERFRTFLLGCFSAIALLLAVVGIFGVISYNVSQRTHEIGIRMALGAQRRDILRMVLAQGTRLALFGVLAGSAAALLLTRLIAGFLYGVSPVDPLTFAAAAIGLLVVAVSACYVPAARAIRVDPTAALRCD
jgi:predicted permease